MTFLTTHLPRLITGCAALALVVSLGLNASAMAEEKKDANPAATAASLSKQDVEKIIEEYLMNNGKVIMDAVNTYQTNELTARSAEGIAKSHDRLFNDGKAPFMGNKDGDVTVVEFFDYNCGYCKKVLPDVQKLIDNDKNVKIVFFDLPILGPTSETAARWALAAHLQDKYFEFHRRMMEHTGAIDDAALRDVAKAAGLDVDKAAKDADGTDVTLHIEKNRELAKDVGISGTPAFIINDQLFPGAVGYDQLKEAVATVRNQKKPD